MYLGNQFHEKNLFNIGAMYYYYLCTIFLKAYILRLEMVLCSVQLGIQGLQLIFSLICLISFYGGTFWKSWWFIRNEKSMLSKNCMLVSAFDYKS